MAKFKFFSTSAADAEIRAADAAINPLLTAAKITTIDVNGKPLPATDDAVPLASKITALAAVNKPGAGDAEMAQMLANNTLLANEATALQTKLAGAESNVSALTGENVSLKARVTLLESNVQTLTASNAELTNLRAAAVTEAGRVTSQINSINTEISKKALAWNAVSDLRGEDGNVLSSKATDAEKLAAADRIPVAEKLTAIGGAVTSALQRAGVRADNTPAQPTAGTTGSKPKMSRAEFHKLEAKAQTAFLAAPHEFTD